MNACSCEQLNRIVVVPSKLSDALDVFLGRENNKYTRSLDCLVADSQELFESIVCRLSQDGSENPRVTVDIRDLSKPDNKVAVDATPKVDFDLARAVATRCEALAIVVASLIFKVGANQINFNNFPDNFIIAAATLPIRNTEPPSFCLKEFCQYVQIISDTRDGLNFFGDADTN